MAKLPYIEFSDGFRIPILHEDRNVIAIDKPQGWMLAPVSWQNTGRNLFAALTSSVNAGDFWAKSRGLKFIRFVHRLDADTSGVLLLVKAPGALPAFTELFEDRRVEKVYLAVVRGVPDMAEWKCRLRLAPMQDRPGRMEVNNAIGKDSETLFRVIDKLGDRALVMCWPLTGRTHQIRIHLAAVGHPVWADELYGHVPTTSEEKTDLKLGLRSIRIGYKDPFKAEQIEINADTAEFAKLYGFDPANSALQKFAAPEKALEHPKARFEDVRREEKEQLEKERSERRAERDFDDERQESRRDWQQDEDSAGFASEQANPEGEGRFRDRPPRKPGFGRSSDGPRKFEPRGGGFRRDSGGGGRDFGNRPPQRPGYAKPGSSREFSDGVGGGGGERPRSFNRDERGGDSRGPRRDKPGFGRPYENRGPRDDRGSGGFRGSAGGKPRFGRPNQDRGNQRPYGNQGGGFQEERGDDWGNREGANERRPGVFPSSAKQGLQSGFQKFGGGAGRPTFRSSGSGRSFGGGGGGGGARPNRFGGENRQFRGGDERRPSGSGGGGGGWRGNSSGGGNRPQQKFGGGKPAFGKKPGGRSFKKFQ